MTLRGLLDRFYWTFWCITAVLNGVLAGYMVSHSIMLGRFFNWYLESGNEDPSAPDVHSISRIQ